MDLFSLPSDIKTIILVSCDTDFVPVLNKLRTERNVKVILYYYSDFIRNSKFSLSNHITTACDECCLIDADLLERSKRVA